MVSLGDLSKDYRIYPTDVTREGTARVDGEAKSVVEEDWRLSLQPMRQVPDSDLPSTGVYEDFCAIWQSADTLYYGGRTLDRFVVVRDGDKVIQVQIPFLRSNVSRVD